MQHPVDAEAHDADVASRLEMDVTGALFEGVFEQPVDDGHHVLFVGIEVLVLAQFDQLFQVLHAYNLASLCTVGQLHRVGETVDLRQIAVDFERVGHHQQYLELEDAFQVTDPVGAERFGGGDGDILVRHFDRHDLEPVCVGLGNDGGNGAEVEFQRVDVKIGNVEAAGEPFGKKLDGVGLAGRLRIGPELIGNDCQRVDVGTVQLAILEQPFRNLLGDHGVVHHQAQDFAQGQLVVTLGRRGKTVLTHQSPPGIT
ncbi:hypothetical protein GALL_409030 [mine drainage metagenome]|uniref:Uncharacterized protein n=1 Tax=mine drainage metagenome TaxID=410659 RepID=A0A1J5Q280_9ZZZZ